AWANDLEVAVAHDRGDGQALLAVATVAADSDDTTIPVRSTTGLSANRTVSIVRRSAAAQKRTITAVGDGVVTVDTAIDVQAGDRIAVAIGAADTEFRFSSGGGIHPGDVLEARDAAQEAEWVVTAVRKEAAAFVVTVQANGADVPGARFIDRVVVLEGSIGAKASVFALKAFTFGGVSAGFAPSKTGHLPDTTRAIAPDGAVGVWAAATGFSFPHEISSGPVRVEALQRLRRYSDTGVSFTGNQLTDRYGFVSEGVLLRLTPADPAANAVAEVVRTADGFTLVSGAAFDEPATEYVTVETIFP
ncbi:MAG: hypothetical protein ACRDT9_02995, partial [Agromyces sp.]